MTDLLTRLENAKEGSRELDVEIVEYLHPGCYWKPYSPRARKNWLYSVDDKMLYTGTEYMPRYTTSLDAALTLVPGGAEISMTNLYKVPMAEVGLNFPDGPHTSRLEHGTLALAICIAALRARAA